jgi:hypothetical protein
MKKTKKFSEFVTEGLHSVTKEDINSLIKRIKKNKGIDVKWLGKQEDQYFHYIINDTDYRSLTKKEAYDTIKNKYNDNSLIDENKNQKK